jgi:hypothetical protein
VSDLAANYSPITDWTPEGRSALVRARGWEIRLLLDEAFTTLLDEPGEQLSDYGFRGDDPVTEAVAWCVQRFETVNLDPARLNAGSRSFRLFTEVDFWLAQRATARGHQARQMRAKSRAAGVDPTTLEDKRAQLGEPQFLDRIFATLPVLRERTCAGLVELWFEGSANLRGEWFGWSDAQKDSATDMSAKKRSFLVADALFRFLVLLEDLLERATSLGLVVCGRALFSGCADVAPYRAPDADVARELRLDGPRAVQKARKQGVRELLVAAFPIACERESLRGLFAGASLRPSLLHLYDLEAEPTVAFVRSLRVAEGRE